MAWAQAWALVRELEEWPWDDFLPLGALCLGVSSTSAEREFSDSPHQVFALRLMQAERPRLPMVPM
ncbi:hypothetical protein MESS2_730185 [Mesorhizobium metallidurans STM 2683]|uniref:Uncharacterized protein n=1 Tax=Mesorhizobium metallidurans STM 2683 TaxID=1297569 RepID=M5ETJ4_9HYPH|nr:hypothetical protein MESS2_730185 [Mesorhizobium metallidurans STM 2683]